MTILQPIGTQGCGCDRRDTLKALLSVDDALALIDERTTAITETEMLATELALGRILADPVTSLQMPPPFDNAAMDGYAVARALKADPLTAHIVLVALTGYGSEQDRQRAFDAGFDHHFTKPIKLEDLDAILA